MKEKKRDHSEILIHFAIEFWRLEKRIAKIKPLLKNKDGESFLDQIERMRDVFSSHQIEIHDPKGEPYKDGRALKAIFFEDCDHLAPGECQVIETIKPSICSRGVQIAAGEVIVGQGKVKKGPKADR